MRVRASLSNGIHLSFDVRHSQRRTALLSIRVPAEHLEIAPVEIVAQRHVQRDLGIVEVCGEVEVFPFAGLVLDRKASVVVELMAVKEVSIPAVCQRLDVLLHQLVCELRSEPDLVEQNAIPTSGDSARPKETPFETSSHTYSSSSAAL
jgi:hypothetical protein